MSPPGSGSLLPDIAAWIGLGIFVKASIIILVTLTAAYLLKRSSSATRCAIWSVGLILLVAMPLMPLLFPSWQLERERLLETLTPAGIVTTEVTTGSPAQPVGSGVPGTIQAAGAGQTRPAAGGGRNSITTALMAVWLMGVILMAMRLLAHTIGAHRIVLEAGRSDDRELARDSIRLRISCGIKRPVRVISSERASIPFSTGLLNPVVVFPSTAEGWGREQKRSVLLHEFAHIARRDHAVHLFIEIVRIFYWPNPLVWFAARRSAVERERACDDFVIRSGAPSETYATHLFQIARSQTGRIVPAAVATMAGRSGLIERIRCIMNSQLDRSPVRRANMLLAGTVAFLITIPIATYGIIGAQVEIPSTAELIRDLETDGDPLVRRQAAWWLGEHEDRAAVRPLIRALRDESADVRLVSAWALGEIKDSRAISSLIYTLEDGDLIVREMAVLALGEIEDPKATDVLSGVFDREEDLRAAVVWALGEISGDEAEMAREAAFTVWRRSSRENDEVWTGSLDWERIREGGGQTGNAATLLNDLRSGSGERRRAATFELGLLGINGDESAIQGVIPLLDTLRDPVPEVRAMAVWALDEINPSRWGENYRPPYRKKF